MMAGTPSSADVSDLNSARSLAALSVAPGSTVLCIERGDTSAAHLLQRRGCGVATVHLDHRSDTFVVPACASVLAGDTEPGGTTAPLVDGTFDAILMLDVLGYIRQPEVALAWAQALLKPGGRLIASFSNVAHASVRVSLLLGTFPYADAGPLDRARVRFFERRSAEALLAAAGLDIEERLRVTRDLDDTEMPTDISTCPPGVVDRIRQDPESTTYEFVFAASPARSSSRPRSGGSLAERLQHRVEELETENHAMTEAALRMTAEAEARAATIHALEEQASQHRQRASSLEAELSRRMEELHARRCDLQQLQADVADREAFIAQFRARALADRAALDALGAELQEARAELADYAARMAAVEVGPAQRAGLANTLSELERTKAELRAARLHASSAGFRLANRVSLGLRRYPLLYNPLRSIVRRLVR